MAKTASNASVLQRGTGQRTLAKHDRFAFDISGYLSLGSLVASDQLKELRVAVDGAMETSTAGSGASNDIEAVRIGPHLELRNAVELGAPFRRLAAAPPIPGYLRELIWGNQVRLVGSRVLIRRPGAVSVLTQGGVADPHRYKRFRAFIEGEFRCLMVSLLFALDDVGADDGTIALVPASHKAQFAHPYEGLPPDQIPALRPLPLAAGQAVLFSENVSYSLLPVVSAARRWLLYQYGPSYVLDWPGCTPSAATRAAAEQDGDSELGTLVREPYYH